MKTCQSVQEILFVCVEVLQPSQPNGVMSSVVSLSNHTFTGQAKSSKRLTSIVHIVCLFVLKFYGPVNPMGSCRERSVYLTTLLMGRLSPLSG